MMMMVARAKVLGAGVAAAVLVVGGVLALRGGGGPQPEARAFLGDFFTGNLGGAEAVATPESASVLRQAYLAGSVDTAFSGGMKGIQWSVGACTVRGINAMCTVRFANEPLFTPLTLVLTQTGGTWRVNVPDFAAWVAS